ncbi:MAG: GNAT family N-acetyltransferase [Caldiserica bacterium]|nr:GNAT family N-acetyltransferase [Caldisericota bacterium]
MSVFAPQRVRLRDGSEVVLRCFRPGEDMAAWCEMIRSCSRETLWRRFELRSPEAIASKPEEFCRCEPGSDHILVAERGGKILGEARLCLFPGGEAAEFCVLVADPWQGLGLGSLLTDTALGAARRLGVRRLVVEVVPENVTIVRLLEKRGFTFRRDPDGRIFFGEKHLD